jgi:hypothetical protein
LDEFKYNAKTEFGVTEQVIEIRYIHFESRRRKKLKILAEYMRNNKQSLVQPGSRKDVDPGTKQLTEIHDALRTGSLS